jgi:hypothetical protein
MSDHPHAVYVIRLRQIRGGQDEVRLLRWALKVLLRRFGWRAISIMEEAMSGTTSGPGSAA